MSTGVEREVSAWGLPCEQKLVPRGVCPYQTLQSV